MPAFEKIGVHALLTTNKKHDLYLSFSFFRMGSSKPRLLRLDGVYYNKNSRKDTQANLRLLKSLRKADGVIYQSAFSKAVCDSYLTEVSVPSEIIPNGANPEEFLSKRPADSDYRFNFLAAARWRRFKRLKETIRAFIALDNPDACLWVAGETPKSIQHPRVKYLGPLRPQKLARYYRLADAVIHISWVDACPNTVVEAICSGTPVICNNVGGTPEIVGKSGIICDIDAPYNFGNFDPYSCPSIEIGSITKAMNDIIERNVMVDMHRPDLHIDEVARKYKAFFKRVINEKNR